MCCLPALGIAVLLGFCGMLTAEVVEEETWYNAEGVVVKTVKRTYSGVDAHSSPDWEPAWVARERRGPVRTVRYSSAYSSGYSYGSGYASWGRTFIGTGCYRRPSYGYRPIATPYRRGGVSGFYRGGGRAGRSSWGVSYRAPGLILHYRH